LRNELDGRIDERDESHFDPALKLERASAILILENSMCLPKVVDIDCAR